MDRDARTSWLATTALAALALAVVLIVPRLRRDHELIRDVSEASRHVRERYIGEVDEDEIRHAALDGMTEVLDPYSAYFRPEEVAEMQEDNEGSFGGVGIIVRQDDRGQTVIEATIEGYPAFRSGLREGDRIISVDGVSVEGLRHHAVVRRIKGEVDSPVRLGVLRAGEDEPLEFTVVRRRIKIESVRSPTILDPDHGIGYVRLTQFQENSAEDLRAAILDLRDQGMESLVLDLRHNPGGILPGAIDIASLLLPRGSLVVRTISRQGQDEYRVEDGRTLDPFPLVVLVNGRSASASEIVAAAVQDHGRGALVGTRTFGKASVQTLIPIGDGSSRLKLTTQWYETPGGRIIHRERDDTEEDEWGLIPDVEVPFSADVFDHLRRLRDQHHLDAKAGKTTSIDSPPGLPADRLRDAVDLLSPAEEDPSVREAIRILEDRLDAEEPYARALRIFGGEEPDPQVEEAMRILREPRRYEAILTRGAGAGNRDVSKTARGDD